MFTYRNKLTGAEFRSECKCSGKNWELVAPGSVATSQPEEKPKRTTRKKASDDK